MSRKALISPVDTLRYDVLERLGGEGISGSHLEREVIT